MKVSYFRRLDILAVVLLLSYPCLLTSLFNATNASADSPAAAETWLSQHHDAFLKDLSHLLSIPSVSAHPDRKSDIIQGGRWVMEKLKKIGIENLKFLEKGGAPAVYGDWLHAEMADAPTVLIYGHYDVQPADSAGGAWITPPFEPAVRDDKIYARGAADNKGPVVSIIYALESIFAVNKKRGLPVNVKLIIEGEEEIGSPTMDAVVEEYGELLKADYAFSGDGGQVGAKAPPGLIVGLRGVAGLEITVSREGGDLHSGMFGGAIGNPLHHLARILDDLRDKETGKVLVDGFYDRVDKVGEVQKNDIATFKKYMPWEDTVLKSLGTSASYGEKGFSPYERVWFRPTLEIVGFNGGYTGAGIKTVLPRTASAKIACRLVTSQNAGEIVDQVSSYVKKIKAPGLNVKVAPLHFKANPVRVRRDGVGNTAAKRVMTKLFEMSPIYVYAGGTVPVVEIMQRRLAIDMVTFGFCTPGTNVHGPNEFARIAELKRTQVAYVKLLYEILVQHQRAKGQKGNDKDEL